MNFTSYSSVLVDKSLLYFMADNLLIREYDLARHKLARIGPPPPYSNPGYEGRFNILVAQDGGLGVCQYMDPDLKLYVSLNM